MTEVWKDIKGYEGLYQVSNIGRVKSLERKHKIILHGKECLRHQKERIMKQWKRSVYWLVDLWKDGKRDIRSVHHLVFET
ncbi:MAG: HNH endonuclease, partial [Alphaproteobacteria bacterium]|nr:HNH endonuclease [Alphaproteobacteria bacterium]